MSALMDKKPHINRKIKENALKYLLTVLTLCFFISCATPQPHGKTDKADPAGQIDPETLHAYLLATRAESNIEKIRKIMLLQMQKAFEQMVREDLNRNPIKNTADEARVVSLLNEAVTNFVARLDKRLEEIMPFHEIEQKIYAPVIGRHLTKTDLSAIIAFYNSPAGKKFIDAVPAVMQDINKMVNQVYGKRLQESVQVIGKEEFDKIRYEMELLRKK